MNLFPSHPAMQALLIARDCDEAGQHERASVYRNLYETDFAVRSRLDYDTERQVPMARQLVPLVLDVKSTVPIEARDALVEMFVQRVAAAWARIGAVGHRLVDLNGLMVRATKAAALDDEMFMFDCQHIMAGDDFVLTSLTLA